MSDDPLKHMREIQEMIDRISGRQVVGPMLDLQEQVGQTQRLADQISGRSILGPMFDMQERMRHVSHFAEVFRQARWQEDLIKQVSATRAVIADVFAAEDIGRAMMGTELQGLAAAMTSIQHRLALPSRVCVQAGTGSNARPSGRSTGHGDGAGNRSACPAIAHRTGNAFLGRLR